MPSSGRPSGFEIVDFVDLAEVEITPHDDIRLHSESVADRYEFLDCQIGGSALNRAIVGTVYIGSLGQRDLRKASAVSCMPENDPDFAGYVICFGCLGDDGLLTVGCARVHTEILLFLGLKVLLNAKSAA